jgi:hypothetical protein
VGITNRPVFINVIVNIIINFIIDIIARLPLFVIARPPFFVIARLDRATQRRHCSRGKNWIIRSSRMMTITGLLQNFGLAHFY